MDHQKKTINNIDKSKWRKEGFLLQMAPNQYLLGSGPFYVSRLPHQDKWNLFRPPFFPSKFSDQSEGFFWYVPSTACFFSRKELIFFLKDQTQEQNISHWAWEEPCFFHFQDFFWKAKKQIKTGKIQKVVPALFETAPYLLKEKDIPTLIYQLISRSGEKTVYAWWSDGQAIIGNTPECLFRKKGLYVQTMALAGTARDSHHNLLTDPKEMKEHKVVVDTIKDLLSSLGKYYFSGTYMYSLGDICHLRTDFKLQLEQDISCKKLCQILHPTPALGGFPRKEALELLWEFHKKTHLRYDFGAPFGVVKNKEAFCVVAIRNMQFIKGKVYLGSGCGLVKESHLEREWEELKKKRAFVWNGFCKEQERRKL